MPFARRSTLGRPMDLAHRFGVPASTSAHCCTHIRTALKCSRPAVGARGGYHEYAAAQQL
jgi:hypothetical protein